MGYTKNVKEWWIKKPKINNQNEDNICPKNDVFAALHHHEKNW